MRIQACTGGGDYLGDKYRAKASGAAKEACDLFVETEDLVGLEQYVEASEKGKEAAKSFRSNGDNCGAADSYRAVVKALIGEGKHSDAQQLARDELSRFRGAGDKGSEAKMLVSIAESNTATDGKLKAEAISFAKEARAIFRNQGDKFMEVKALLALAATNMNKGEVDLAGVETALKNANEAKDIAQETDNKRIEAECLHTIAEARGIVSSPEDALEAADEAMDLYLELRDKRMEAFELMKMSEWNVKLGDHARALSDAEDALDIYQMLQSPQEVTALRTVFDAHMARADLRKARLVAAEALRRFREQGNKPAQVKASRMLVEMYVKANRLDEALTAAKRGISVCKELGDVAGQASLMLAVGRARLRMGQTDKAMAVTQDAWAMLKSVPSSTSQISTDKVEAMQIVADASFTAKKMEEARDAVLEFKDHFEEMDDAKGMANSFLILASLEFRRQKLDVAQGYITKAQSIFNEEGDLKGEADSLKLHGELCWKRNEFKAAVRLGERARALYREIQKLEGEIACMYMISENAVRLSVKEGAKIYNEEPIPRTARDALDKGIKLAEAGIKMARNANITQKNELLGSLLCARAQGLTLKARFEDALACADEAVLMFRDIGAYQLEANSLMLSCDNLRALDQTREAAEAADEALALYKHVEDEHGTKLAEEVMTSFQKYLQPAQPQYAPPPPGMQPGAPQQPPVWQQQQAQQGPPEAAVAKPAAPRGPAGPALDVKAGLSVEVVTSKVKEIASRITGADDGEIEADTPLMEAGLTSNSAILMRDELSQALPGVSLPVTLVFDYPSVSAMAELILQSTGAQAIGN